MLGMKTKFEEKLRNLCLFFADDYKKKIRYIAKIPFALKGINIRYPVLNMFTKGSSVTAPGLEEYYLSVYPLLENIYENIRSCNSEKYAFIKTFIDDIIPLLEMYYRILENNCIVSLKKEVLPPIKYFLDYTLRVYFDLGEDIYKNVIKDILDFAATINNIFEFMIISNYPFLCSIDKSYYKDCINVYKNKIFYKGYNVIVLLDILCKKYLEKDVLKDRILNSMMRFRQLCEKMDNGYDLKNNVYDFILYLYIDTYNSIFHNINVEELFKLLKYVGYSNIFCFRNEEEVFWYLNPRILDTFINTIININKNNFDILEKISNIDISISDTVCNIVLYDIIIDEIRKNGRNDILFMTHSRFDFIEQYINIFSKYKYIPSFVKSFIYSLNHCVIFNSVMLYLNDKSKYIYSYNLCDIYLTNPEILYNIISSKKFFEIYYKSISFSKYERNRKYLLEYYIVFRNFIGYMEIVEYKDRNIKFEDFIVSNDIWGDSYRYILEHFLLIVCFVILPILIKKNNKNSIEYIDKVLASITKAIFEGKIGSNSKNMPCKSMSYYFSEAINKNEKIYQKFSLESISLYPSCFKKTVNCLAFMCLLYYFGINLIDNCNLQNKIKILFNAIDKKSSKDFFNILYTIYSNSTKNNLDEIVGLSTDICKLM